MSIRYVIGDATQPEGEGTKVIVHVCNDIGAWGAGFVKALSKRWPEPERQYRGWYQSCKPASMPLGAWEPVWVNSGLCVINLIGQEGIRTSKEGIPPVRYGAIRRGLMSIGDWAMRKGVSIHMPRIGCGLAGGEWSEIEPIINGTLIARGVPVTVYDLEGK